MLLDLSFDASSAVIVPDAPSAPFASRSRIPKLGGPVEKMSVLRRKSLVGLTFVVVVMCCVVLQNLEKNFPV